MCPVGNWKYGFGNQQRSGLDIEFWKVKKWKWSCLVVSDSATPWTVACQAPPSMGFSRQEYWSGLPFLSPRDLPDPGIEPRSPAFQADALTAEPPLNSENRHIWDCCSYRHACMLSRFSHVWLWPYGLWPTRFLIPWDSPGKKTSGLPFPSPGDLPDSGI